MNLYERIEQLCKRQSLSINKMCEKAGIRSSILYDIKSGKKQGVSRATAEKIANALRISVDELYGEKEKTPDAEAPRDIENAKFNELLATLPAEEQQKVYDYLQFVADKYKHR